MARSARLAITVLTLFFCSHAAAQDLTVAPLAETPPAEIGGPLKAALSPKALRVAIGAKTLDFWWVEAVPLQPGAGDPSWAQVQEGTLVGAVRISAAHNDIRGHAIKPGVYTLRYALQPANGDHLGVSPYRDFLLVSPAAIDQDPKPVGHDAAVELSKRSVGISHPAVWSLDPPVAKQDPLKPVTNDQGNKSLVFEIPAQRDGKPAGALRFGLILVGRIEAN